MVCGGLPAETSHSAKLAHCQSPGTMYWVGFTSTKSLTCDNNISFTLGKQTTSSSHNNKEQKIRGATQRWKMGEHMRTTNMQVLAGIIDRSKEEWWIMQVLLKCQVTSKEHSKDPCIPWCNLSIFTCENMSFLASHWINIWVRPSSTPKPRPCWSYHFLHFNFPGAKSGAVPSDKGGIGKVKGWPDSCDKDIPRQLDCIHLKIYTHTYIYIYEQILWSVVKIQSLVQNEKRMTKILLLCPWALCFKHLETQQQHIQGQALCKASWQYKNHVS